MSRLRHRNVHLHIHFLLSWTAVDSDSALKLKGVRKMPNWRPESSRPARAPWDHEKILDTPPCGYYQTRDVTGGQSTVSWVTEPELAHPGVETASDDHALVDAVRRLDSSAPMVDETPPRCELHIGFMTFATFFLPQRRNEFMYPWLRHGNSAHVCTISIFQSSSVLTCPKEGKYIEKK